jgi:Trp operon repressor
MATPSIVEEILQKRMDRKDFLKHIGMGVAALTGVAAVVKAFKPQQRENGYGSAAYGGRGLQK